MALPTFHSLVRLRNSARPYVRHLVRACGYDIVRWHPTPPAAQSRQRLLECHGINVVLDVGANTGQFASELRNVVGFKGRIISFEPIPNLFPKLVEASQADPQWDAHNLALGDADTEHTLHVSHNKVSSSFLDVQKASTDAAPESAFESECTVSVRTLDNLLPELLPASDKNTLMLKIDTQGYESRVLAGARQSLKNISLVQMEMSLTTLYAGEVLFLDMCNAMRADGFDLVGLDPGFSNRATGRLLQVDGLFSRTPALKLAP